MLCFSSPIITRSHTMQVHCDLCTAPIESSLSCVCEACKAWCKNAPIWRNTSRCCAGCDRHIAGAAFSYCKMCLLDAKGVLELHARESWEGVDSGGDNHKSFTVTVLQGGCTTAVVFHQPTADSIVVGQEVEFEGTVIGRY